MSSVWKPEQAWRRRADLNSLGLAVLLILIAFLFGKTFSLAGDLRDNQCEQIRSSVTERQIIVRQTREPNALTMYWEHELLPQLKQRFERVDCSPPLPGLKNHH